jgi:hypothetical protein
MKVTINIECTPEEARSYMGLPDVQPLQKEMMKIMRDKTLENLKRMEPEGMMQMMNQGVGQMNDFLKSAMMGGMSSSKSERKK